MQTSPPPIKISEKQAVFPSSDFYTPKSAESLTETIQNQLGGIHPLARMVTDYVGIRILADGEIVLVEDKAKTWIPVRVQLHKNDKWMAESLLDSSFLCPLTCPTEQIGIRDTYPDIHDEIDGPLSSSKSNKRLLARFLFCSTDPANDKPLFLRLSAQQLKKLRGLDTFKHDYSFDWGDEDLRKLLPAPRCDPIYPHDLPPLEDANTFLDDEYRTDPLQDAYDDSFPYHVQDF